MKQITLYSGLSAVLLVGSSMVFGAPQIDLAGHVVDPQGVGIKNAVVQLAAEKISDTTDSNGDFHLVGIVQAISAASGEKDNFYFSFDRNSIVLARRIRAATIELFDISGKKLSSADFNDDGNANRRINLDNLIPHRTSSLYLVRIDDGVHDAVRTIAATGGGSTGLPVFSRLGVLAKQSTTSDTLVIAKDGYGEKKIGLTNYQQNLGTIQLLPDADTFSIRVPSKKTVVCSRGGAIEVWDLDFVCDCRNDSLQAAIYMQTRPDSCALYPYYSVVGAWIKINGKISPLQSAFYNYGGNHHNDMLLFTYGGHTYGIFHSSLGYGGRCCTSPDCMQICVDDQCRTIKFNGCARQACADRPALKVTCVQVQSDGSVPPLLDPWVAHTGSPTYPFLPCPGDQLCK
jgi:hypothetical protein